MMRLRILCFWLLILLMSPLALAMMFLHNLFGSYGRALAMARNYDRIANILLGGSERETISSRVGRNQRNGLWHGKLLAPLIDVFFGKDHCRKAIGT